MHREGVRGAGRGGEEGQEGQEGQEMWESHTAPYSLALSTLRDWLEKQAIKEAALAAAADRPQSEKRRRAAPKKKVGCGEMRGGGGRGRE